MKQLTENESVIMELICNGVSQPDIAKKKCVTIGTVKSTIDKIYVKLGAVNAPHAVAIYLGKFNTTKDIQK